MGPGGGMDSFGGTRRNATVTKYGALMELIEDVAAVFAGHDLTPEQHDRVEVAAFYRFEKRVDADEPGDAAGDWYAGEQELYPRHHHGDHGPHDPHDPHHPHRPHGDVVAGEPAATEPPADV